MHNFKKIRYCIGSDTVKKEDDPVATMWGWTVSDRSLSNGECFILFVPNILNELI